MDLVIGVGNPLRCDDGVGPEIVGRIASLSIPGVETLITQQLHVDMLEEIVAYDRVIVVDASSRGDPLELYRIQDEALKHVASSHHLSVPLLADLARRVYHKKLDIYVCALKGDCFDIGEKISPRLLERADTAVGKIIALLKEGSHA